MSFLSRLFGKKDDGPASLAERIAKLEAQASSARAGHVGTPLNKAGDLALNHGDEAQAAHYYGRAIDAFLEDGQREAARGVAQKIIRVRPTAVRTLCTLCWLDLAARHDATALLHLRDYVEAAKSVNRQSLAGSQIYEMAKLVPDSEFIGAAADALDQLDQSSLAEDVRKWIRSGGSDEAIHDPTELADACLAAAIHSNERTVLPEADGEGGEGEGEAVSETPDQTPSESHADEEDAAADEASAEAEEPTEEEAPDAATEEEAPEEPAVVETDGAPAGEDESSAEADDETPADDEEPGEEAEEATEAEAEAESDEEADDAPADDDSATGDGSTVEEAEEPEEPEEPDDAATQDAATEDDGPAESKPKKASKGDDSGSKRKKKRKKKKKKKKKR